MPVTLTLLTLIPLLAPSAKAQDSGYFPGYDPSTLMYMDAMSYAAQAGASSAEFAADANAKRARAKSNPKKTKSKSPAPPRVAILTYTPSRARTQANVATFAAKMKGRDPEGAAKMKSLFASTDVMAKLGAAIRPLGLATNNVADAYALWWTTAWLASEGRSNPTRTQIQGVRGQVRNVLLRSPEIAKMTDAKKQEFAEAFLIQAMLVDASFEAAKEDPSLMEPMKAAVIRGARATGLDFAKIKLTEAGFRPR